MKTSRPNRRTGRWVILLVAVTVVVAVTVYSVFKTTPPDDNRQEYTLMIRVIPQGTGDYSVILPLIVPLNDSAVPIAENALVLNVVGNHSARMIETQYGYAFELNATSALDVNVRFTKELDPSWRYDHFGLSMCSEGCGQSTRIYPYSAHLNSSGITYVDVYENLTFAKSTSKVYVDGFYLCSGRLYQGWQSLQGLHRMSLS